MIVNYRGGDYVFLLIMTKITLTVDINFKKLKFSLFNLFTKVVCP